MKIGDWVWLWSNDVCVTNKLGVSTKHLKAAIVEWKRGVRGRILEIGTRNTVVLTVKDSVLLVGIEYLTNIEPLIKRRGSFVSVYLDSENWDIWME